ncbi:Microrchidia-like protein [Thalictrum thalictroides]|uniref:Microrchidia-like protein n=1 Tax=Thalictrum thalictroides TaxID=46969 RepID=A0A7J6VZJ3_THATH|nr:Microrchidia-like protein [Thalictrum thalictroides]
MSYVLHHTQLNFGSAYLFTDIYYAIVWLLLLTAIAELLDNAFDEVQNGASFVVVDKTINPKDGCPALLIHDDGGGMDPESMRQCMSFGFSAKKSNSAIGQYGNGFKTSTMRLGADVIVFSRHTSKRTLTQSVGLLSYTFLRQTGHDRIVVPMVDYEFEASTGKIRNLSSNSAEHISANLSMLLQWSPYGTEEELLKQFDNMGHHGTKVIIYNLWFNDDGELELDFGSDTEDILIAGARKSSETRQAKMLAQQHIASRFSDSLRVYLSILYLRIPKNFRIILRGRVVEHHNIANDLKFPEFILYKPQISGSTEAAVITTIGFLKDAPQVNFHGFSVYHKNRLIMPFWGVISQTNSRGRGVAGVLEANFIEPTHNKQEFEKTAVFQKLEARLKDMTLEYWDFHCGLIGYLQTKKPSTARVPPSKACSLQPVMMNPSSPTLNSPRVASAAAYHNSPDIHTRSEGRPEKSVGNYKTISAPAPTMKRKRHRHAVEAERVERPAGSEENTTNIRRHHWEVQPAANGTEKQMQNQEIESLMQENKKLHAQCLEYEKSEEELNSKLVGLKLELLEVQHEYARLLSESESMEGAVKDENT